MKTGWEIDDEDEEELEMKMCSFSKFISQVLFRRCPTDLVKLLDLSIIDITRVESSLRLDQTLNQRLSQVEIYAPRLTTFKYSGTPPIVCLTDHPDSVDDVYFDLKTPPRFKRSEKEYGLRLINILNEFRHAKSLTLSLSVEVLTKCCSLRDQDLRPFANLKIKVDKWLFMKPKSFERILDSLLSCSATMKLCMDSQMAGHESPVGSD
ncbi:F-box/RNI-like superfamily protein isoform 2 [Theobroma cacao]|uniref:F-box/RNI-like superfamily protein isoform 2 n=1 Tax=Theobroma cacao TaxID=3641 RepID=A0A061FZ49_THECC|nr:F-box/RNI-like superfamily protein isoform 2 [Theobroma cacao]